MPISSPTIDNFELARAGRELRGEVAAAQLPRLSEFLATTQGGLRYRIAGLIDSEGYPAADLHLEGQLQLVCQRCNAPLEFNLDRTARFRFVADEDQLNAMPIENDEIEAIVGSAHANLHDWVEDEVLLSLPLVPRHQQCSIPLSAENNSGTVAAANPFAILLQLRGDDDTKRHN